MSKPIGTNISLWAKYMKYDEWDFEDDYNFYNSFCFWVYIDYYIILGLANFVHILHDNFGDCSFNLLNA